MANPSQSHANPSQSRGERNNTGGTSTANDGSHAAALLGQFMASSLVTAGDSHSGTPLADPPPNQPPLLTQPHA